MANSYENTIMPEQPVEQIKPDAIPVDDKGQPLPDPTENLSGYIAPKGVEELRKAYSEVEVDEDVRNTMEPPQKTGFLRKHRPGKRGYDYYGTPAGSIPNDNNGLKPSPLSELFSEAEALEPDFDIEKIKDHVLNPYPEAGSELKVVETPKLDPTLIDNNNEQGKKSDDSILKRTEVVKDPNAPKFLDMYKESTNTRVIYQFDENEDQQPSKKTENAEQIFAGDSGVSNPTRPLSRREERKAKKAAKKAEKKRAKDRKKAEKVAKKAAKKAQKSGIPFDNSVTSPEEIIKLRESRIEKAEPANEVQAKEDIKEKIESEKQIEEANRLKEEAQLEAKLTAQEAEKRIKEEREAILKEQEEKEQAMKNQLNEEKAAAQQAAEEAKSAREEAERLKAELEEMKKAAAQALAQKQEAEEAAKAVLEEKEQTKTKKTASKSEVEKADKELKDTAPKAKAKKEAPKEVTEKPKTAAKPKSNTKKAKAEEAKGDSPSTESIRRRLAEMESQLSKKESDE